MIEGTFDKIDTGSDSQGVLLIECQCCKDFVNLVHDRNHSWKAGIRRRETKSSIFENLGRLYNLHMSTFEIRVLYLENVTQFLKLELPLLCECVDCFSMVKCILKHVKCRVPASGDITWQQRDHHSQLTQDFLPCWQEYGCRMNNLVCKFVQLVGPFSMQVCL